MPSIVPCDCQTNPRRGRAPGGPVTGQSTTPITGPLASSPSRISLAAWQPPYLGYVFVAPVKALSNLKYTGRAPFNKISSPSNHPPHLFLNRHLKNPRIAKALQKLNLKPHQGRQFQIQNKDSIRPSRPRLSSNFPPNCSPSAAKQSKQQRQKPNKSRRVYGVYNVYLAVGQGGCTRRLAGRDDDDARRRRRELEARCVWVTLKSLPPARLMAELSVFKCAAVCIQRERSLCMHSSAMRAPGRARV